MLLGEEGPHERGGETGTPPLKRRYFSIIGSSNVCLLYTSDAADE